MKGHGVLTPEEIQSREFLVSLRGYDRDEVHAFLDEVAESFAELLTDGGTSTPSAPAQAEESVAVEPDAPEPEVIAEAPVETPPAAAPESLFAAIGAETQRILEAAQAAGDEIRRRAESEAADARASALAEAEGQVKQLREQASATQAQIDVLQQRRDELGERLRQARETVDLAMLELDDSPMDVAPTDATNSVLAADAGVDDDEVDDDDV